MKNLNLQLRDQFLKWQCRIRQIAFREQAGRPSTGMMPILLNRTNTGSQYQIITVLNKLPEFSKISELKHMALKTNDPAERRVSAFKFFGEIYFQNATQFSDILTAAFPPNSKLAQKIVKLSRCILAHEQFNQRYNIVCYPVTLLKTNQLHNATYWHNFLFNPLLPSNISIIGFQPDWTSSTFYSANSKESIGK